MKHKDLRHLNRSELLKLLLAQVQENNRLKEQIADLNKQLHQRKLTIENAGSIAQAALELNGVFEAAQKAAEQYLESVKTGCLQGKITEIPSAEKTSFELQPMTPAEKPAEITVEDYWQQVQKRAESFWNEEE